MKKTIVFIALFALYQQAGANLSSNNGCVLETISGGAPVANADAFSTNEDTAHSGTVTTNDVFSVDDVFAVVNNVNHGILVFNTDGTYTYTPALNFFGADSFVYSVCNPANQCTQATVTITVTAVNDAPIALDAVYEAPYNGVVTATVSGEVSDAEGDALTYTLEEDAEHGTLTFNTDGTYTYTPDLNYAGWDAFVYIVCDSHNACDTATATFIIIDANEYPIAVDDAYTIDEDEELTANVGDNDSDPNGDVLTYSLYLAPTHGTVVMQADGSFIYQPNTYYNGADAFVYRVCDASNQCVLGDVTITIQAVNSAPVAMDDIITGEQNLTIDHNVSINDMDPEGDALTFALVSGVSNGVLVFNSNGSFTYTPNLNYYGTDSFQYQACDASLCDTATAQILIDQIFFNPIAVADSYTINQGATLTDDVSTNDTMNGGAGTYTVVTSVSNGTLLLNGNGTFSYTPAAGFHGTDVFTYSVCNPSNQCDEALVTIVVNELNTIPVAQDDSFTIAEDGFLFASVATNDSDADGDVLTYTVEVGVSNGVLVFSSDGSFTYTPNLNFYGTDHFTYTVCDDDGNCDVATVTIVVTPVNDAPVANDDFYTTDENVEITGFVGNNDTDVDNLSLIYTLGTGPTNGTLVFNANGTFTYIPNANFVGTDSFTYTACDNQGLCDSAIVTITVEEGPNPIPQAVIDQYTTNEDETLYGDVSINDIDMDGYTYSVIQNPSNGSVTMGISGSFVYSPNPDYNGFDEFVYHGCDLLGNCYSATVNIIIVPMPDDDLKIPLGFSPNNDGTNDKFIIENIDSYPNNKLSIFNRWGNIVYEKAPYNDATAWDGTSDSGAVSFGSMVPEGTYFYVLETGPSTLNQGKSEKKSGYIVVKYESK